MVVFLSVRQSEVGLVPASTTQMAADCHTDSNTMSRQHRIRSYLSILLLLHLLLLLISAAAGYPQYGPDYYDEYDEDEYEVEGDDVDQQDLEKMGRMVKMSTNGETFKFDAGTTIRIPCHIENLPGERGKVSRVFNIIKDL